MAKIAVGACAGPFGGRRSQPPAWHAQDPLSPAAPERGFAGRFHGHAPDGPGQVERRSHDRAQSEDDQFPVGRPKSGSRGLDDAQTLPVDVIDGRQVDHQGAPLTPTEPIEHPGQLAGRRARHPPFEAQHDGGAEIFFLDTEIPDGPVVTAHSRGVNQRQGGISLPTFGTVGCI